MATAIQFRRGTTAQHANFTGLVGEITVDTDLDTIRVHDGSTAGGTRLAKYDEVVAAATGDITAVTTVAGSGLTGGAESGNVVLSLDYENLSGNLIPSANNTYSLGSLTNVWKDVFVGPGSLYVNGQKVLEDNNGTIQISADTGQNISIVTTGAGSVELTSGSGVIEMKSNVQLLAGKTISTAGGGATSQAGNINMNSNNINNLDDPVSAQDAATKAYVDAITTTDVNEGTNLYYTDTRSRAALSVTNTAGGDGTLAYNNTTGVFTYTGPSQSEANSRIDAYLSGGDGIDVGSGSISVDTTVVRTSGAQTVGGAKTFTDDTVFSGNVTISGTQTIVNSTVTSLADSILELNRDATGSPSEDAGLQVNRGSGADVSLIWDESEDYWAFTNNGADYYKIAESTDDLAEGVTNLYYTTARAESSFDTKLAAADTDDLSEGATNLYYTDARARGAISLTDAGGDGSLTYNSGTGVITYTGPSASEVRAHLSAGGDLSYDSGTGVISFTERTDAEVRGLVSASGDLSYNSSTGVISFTERTDAEVRGLISASGDISYDSATGVISFTNDAGDIEGVTAGNGLVGGGTTGTVSLAVGAGTGVIVNPGNIQVDLTAFDTDDLSEGTNLYYTDARARAAVSASGDLSYNSSTGVISFTERTDSEVRGLVSASGSLSYNSTTGVFSFTERTDAEVRGLVSADGDLSYNSTTGVFSFTERTDAEVRGLLSGGTGITYNSATGAISLTDTGYVTGVTAGTGLSGGGTDGTVTLNVSGLTVSEFDAGAIQTGAEAFSDSDTVLMTAAAVQDKILSYGYTTNVGDITGVTAGSYLTGGGASGSVTLNVDATSANTAGKVVARDGSGNFAAGVITATATAARYADLAEKYAADADYEPGTVVKFGGDKEITATDSENDHAVMGVISTDPAYMMNNDAEGLFVALAGRVPCKVTGPVAKGDLLISAAGGRAKADNAAQAGRIIGKAMEASEGGDAVIEVLVNMM